MNFLRMFFAGLIAFVPSPQGGAVQVMLVDARTDAKFYDCESPAHFPVLAVPEDNVVPFSEEEPCGAGRLVSLNDLARNVPVALRDVKFCEWDLNNVDIHIVGLDAAEGFDKVNGHRDRLGLGGLLGQKKSPTDKDESVDFSWLAHIGQILPDGGGLAAGIGNGSADDEVAAKITVDTGRLETCHLAQQDKNVYVFDFLDPRSKKKVSYTQSLSDVLRSQARMKSSELSILLTQEGSGTLTDYIALRAGTGNHRLDVLVVNMSDGHHEPAKECENIGIDFARFFFLADRKDHDHMFLPHLTDEYKAASSVQPHCEADADTFFEYLALKYIEDQAAKLHGEGMRDQVKAKSVTWNEEWSPLVKLGKKSLETRSICPMATF